MARNIDRVGAVALAGALVGWSATAGLEIPARRHPLVAAGLGGALVALARAPLGLRPPQVGSGLRTGLVAAAVGALGVALATR
ncbi:MAG TPA: CPBP family intramembrane glutamate endopeptidase, partial [Mycobacterium sp.]|nr:CPBP family intramembrane glutamate endopeptidase [Mycobacterium sp.]